MQQPVEYDTPRFSHQVKDELIFLVPAGDQLFGFQTSLFLAKMLQDGSHSGEQTRTEQVPCWWKRPDGDKTTSDPVYKPVWFIQDAGSNELSWIKPATVCPC